jgi:anti-anti-sigma factor
MELSPFRVETADVALRPIELLGSGEVRLTLPPQLVIANRQQFKHQALDALELLEAGARTIPITMPITIRIDLAGCGYIDSSGLGVLVSIGKAAKAAGARLVLEGMNEDLVALFGFTHLDTLFDIEP